ncbi:MAG: S9 family peptidase, partial [Chitinophagaceae bacterium]
TSTRRNGADRDIYIMDPLDTSSAKLLLKLEGGGWSIGDWSDDEKKILVNKYVSVNESSIWIYDIASSKFEKVLPAVDERVVFSGMEFSADGRAIFVLTNKAGEFMRPAKLDLAKRKLEYLVSDINWEITRYDLTEDQKTAAFTTNEAGETKLYIQDVASKKYSKVSSLPTGIMGNMEWAKDGNSLAFGFGTAKTGGDVYVWDNNSGKLVQWTESELGGMNLSGLPLPELIKWKSFDGLEISGFLYRAPARFSGKQPVIINIHGGPEGQSSPGFIGRMNYLLNELGVSIIFPNVRGSSGFGKTFLDLDNGMKREESVKDIGALIDWIGTQPNLDAARIMVTGGSYGGYMTLATAFHYNDKIRCALDVVGISHFTTFLKNTENYRRDLRRVEYGDERDPVMAAFFEKIAPLNNAHKITKPMFIVQGKNDPRVPFTEAKQMADKIKSNGGVVWYMMANDEGHGFAKKNNQDVQFYATVAFIKKYLL